MDAKANEIKLVILVLCVCSSSPSALLLCCHAIVIGKQTIKGSGGVGKSCVVVRFTQNSFVDTYDPTVQDQYRITQKLDNDDVIVEILDTAGQEELSGAKDIWMKNAHGILLVYSVVDRASFVALRDICNDIEKMKEAWNYPVPICK